MIKQVTQVDKPTWIPRRETGRPEKAFAKMHWCPPKKGSEKEVGKEAGRGGVEGGSSGEWGIFREAEFKEGRGKYGCYRVGRSLSQREKRGRMARAAMKREQEETEEVRRGISQEVQWLRL